jgi:CBS domain-containing protein
MTMIVRQPPSRRASSASRVADIMTNQVLTTTPNTKAVDAALVIALNDITALPVVRGGELVGLFTEDDLLRVHGDQHTLTVGALMIACTLVVSPDTTLAALAEDMAREQVHTVPVVRDGALVGVVSRHDL